VLVLVAAALLALGRTPAASAEEDPTAACLESFERAQGLRRESKLLAAHGELVRCARAECPTAVGRQCGQWLAEVEADTPSIVVVASDARGRDCTSVRVIADGRTLSESLSGAEHRLDPGPHRLRFEISEPAGGVTTLVEDVVLPVGEKRRRLDVRCRPPEEPEGPGVSPLTVAALVVGGAGLALGTVLGVVALDRKSDLESACAEVGCTQDDIDDGAVLAHASTAAFVAGGVVAAAGAVLLLMDLTRDEAARSGRPPHVALRF
jgi:hypothetical protein